jgi:hypothetical protein
MDGRPTNVRELIDENEKAEKEEGRNEGRWILATLFKHRFGKNGEWPKD